MIRPVDSYLHIQIPPTGEVGLIWHSTVEATVSWSTIEGTLRVRCSYFYKSTMHAVAAAYPQSTLNGTPTDSSLNGTASY